MRIREGDTPFRMPGSESPLKKSTSVTAIIHGPDPKPNNIYYVDSLQRFRRDYASVDKSEREQRRAREEEQRGRRRIQIIDRELSFKKIDDCNLDRLKQRQSHSLQLHRQGSRMTIHSHGVAVDPVNLFYQDSEKGRAQARADEEKRLNTLVRSHHLQTMGSSGYNIINGQASMPLEQLMRPEQLPVFQQKLSQYYQKFRIRPNDH